MNITVFPKGRRDRDSLEQACGWLSRIDRDLSDTERNELQAWLDEHPEHPALLVRVAKEWDKFDALSQLIGVRPVGAPRVKKRRRALLAGLGVAASVVIVSTAVFLLRQPQQSPVGRAQVSGARTYTTEVGEKANVTLPDGSELILNTNTRVTVDYTASERSVVLQAGEVYAKVAHDRDHPFNVYVRDRVVRAVGTAFNVEYGARGDLQVIVTDGTVVIHDVPSTDARMVARGQPAVATKLPLTAVKKGEMYKIAAGVAQRRSIEAEELSSQLAWQSGKLIFHGETLAEAIHEIERYTDVEFVVPDDRLNDVTVAGVFRADDIDGLLRTLEDNFGVAHQRLNSHQILLTYRD